MRNITKATAKQWKQIDALRKSVIVGITNQPEDESVRNVVRMMWMRMGAAEPKAVLISDCPMVGSLFFCLLSANSQLRSQLDSQLYSQLHSQLRSQLRSQLGSQLRSQLRSQLGSQLEIQLRSQLDSQLRSQLDSQLGSQLHSQLHSQLDSQLYSQLHSQLRSQLGSQFDSQLRSQLGSQLDSQLDSQLYSQLYVAFFWRAWSGWYEGARILGVDFDMDKFDAFRNWTLHVPAIYANAAIPIVSRFPSTVKWKNGRLHNDSGKAVEFRSGWGLWLIDGIPVDEQIVMRPDTQTVDQIGNEQNQDVRAIRIQRFGWPRYIKESGAVVRHERSNEIEGTLEALFRCGDGSQRLVVTCPTGRIFALGVPGEVNTCEQAQNWLGSDPLNAASRCLFRT